MTHLADSQPGAQAAAVVGVRAGQDLEGVCGN